MLNGVSEPEKIRLLICSTCSSIDPLPWYEGPPELDDTLNYRLSQHRFPSGDPHIGLLANVFEDAWSKQAYRDAIRDKLAEEAGIRLPGQSAGLGETYYDVRSTYAEDAMKCWKQHNRTTDCGDYKTRAKLLLADTRAERKEIGLDPAQRATTYLCQFCPMESIKMQAYRKETGQYDA
jgi:hypothetical protein